MIVSKLSPAGSYIVPTDGSFSAADIESAATVNLINTRADVWPLRQWVLDVWTMLRSSRRMVDTSGTVDSWVRPVWVPEGKDILCCMPYTCV